MEVENEAVVRSPGHVGTYGPANITHVNFGFAHYQYAIFVFH